MSTIYDVAVVGCGPVGAFAANLLGKAGLSVVVLEREGDPYPLPRAVHLDHEMMRLFADAGLIERMTSLMFAADGHIHIGADGALLRFLSAAGEPRPFTFSNDYFFYQPELESALRDALDRFPQVTLRLGAAVVAVAQDEALARLMLADGGTVDARYVIGCDGARSTIRKALAVALDDLQFDEPWLVVDAEVDGPIHFPGYDGVPQEADLQRHSVMLCDPDRPTTVVPGRGNHRRWEFMLLPGEDDQAMMAPATVAALVAPWVAGVPHRIVRATTYHFHGLVAERWQVGRVFLAGDAAHQTPPFFGQGMCHGLRDVANLAWKLALVVRGAAAAVLLDSYQLERDPHVRAVIGAAVDAGRYICELDPDLAAARDARIRGSSGPRTAGDLIPPILAGVVEPGAGQRFVQPQIERHGVHLPLDALTGGGWALVTAGPIALAPPAAGVWAALGGAVVAIGENAQDTDGHLAGWFAQHRASAAIVRPDFYTYAAPADAAGLSDAIVRLGEALHLAPVAQAA